MPNSALVVVSRSASPLEIATTRAVEATEAVLSRGRKALMTFIGPIVLTCI